MSDNFGSFDIESTFGSDDSASQEVPETDSGDTQDGGTPESPVTAPKKRTRKKATRKKRTRATGTFTRDDVARIVSILNEVGSRHDDGPAGLLARLLDVSDGDDDLELPIAIVANGKGVIKTLTKVAGDAEELGGLSRDDRLTFGFLVIERVSRASGEDNARYQRALEAVIREVASDEQYEHDGVIIRSDTAPAKIARARIDGLSILAQRLDHLSSLVAGTESLANG